MICPTVLFMGLEGSLKFSKPLGGYHMMISMFLLSISSSQSEFNFVDRMIVLRIDWGSDAI